MLLTIFYILCSTIWAFIQYKFGDKDDKEFSKHIEAIVTNWLSNLFFVTVFLNFPAIAIWQYMRKNNFLAPEVLEYDYLYNYIGLDFLIINIVVTFVLPIVLASAKEKLIKIAGYLFIIIYLIIIIWEICKNTSLVLPTILFILSAIFYGWGTFLKVKKVKEVLEEFKKNRRLPKQKIQKLSFISAVILILLILMPSLKLDKFTEHTLQRMKLGGFDVTVRTDDKRVLEGFLLLKTKEFYYVYPMCNGKKFAENVVIINTQNTTLIYKAESKNSEIKQEIQESTQKSSGADSINLETK